MDIMLEKGLSAQSRTTVTAANTAATMGSGDLEVFATPSMVALMEHAAMTAVAAALPAGATTVGAEMNVTHIKPSGLGAEITATAVLTGVEGRKLTFNVGARDAEGMIGEGVHVRYVVVGDTRPAGRIFIYNGRGGIAPAPVIPFPLPVRARSAGVRAGSPGCPTHSLRRPAR